MTVRAALLAVVAASSAFAQASILQQQWSGGQCVGQGAVTYTVPPMDPADVSMILPLGMMTDAHVTPVDHQYWRPKDMSLGRDAYPVRVPADGYIVLVQHRDRFIGDMTPANRTDEFRVVLEHSCTFWTYFDLLTSLDPGLIEQMGGAPEGMSSRMVRIPVKAGQVLGRVGGQTLDMGTVDGAAPLAGFVDPGHYRAEPWKILTADPLSYFEEPLRQRLYALNPRLTEPRGGKIDHDVAGRLVGNWFLEGTNGYAGANAARPWAGHFAAAYHYLDPSVLVISLGDWNGASRQFFVRGNAPDPAVVSADSGPVKYELKLGGIGVNEADLRLFEYPMPDRVDGVLLVQVLLDGRLRLETFPGRTAADVDGFTESARIHER